MRRDAERRVRLLFTDVVIAVSGLPGKNDPGEVGPPLACGRPHVIGDDPGTLRAGFLVRFTVFDVGDHADASAVSSAIEGCL